MSDVADTIPTLGVVGVGRMGAPIAESLGKSFAVGVFDIDPAREGTAPGARWFRSLDELSHASDVLVTVLPGPVELQRCVSSALTRLRPGSLWLDLTSGDPGVTRELADQAARANVHAVSAPMGGSLDDAGAAALVFSVSGTDEAVARAHPVLDALSRPGGIRRAGMRAEDGQIVKLLANGLWFANAVAASEAMLVGQGLGLAPADLHALLRDGAGGSRFLDDYFEAVLDGDYRESFGIDRVVEELTTLGGMSAEAGVSTPMLDASARLHRDALQRFGPALGELLAVKILEEQAHRLLRR